MKLPGFDGDTLVCPIGSADSADWKPALAYPLFKSALLAPEPVPPPAAIAMPVPPLPPAAATATPCPRCFHPNPEPARFCNACGAIMAAQTQTPAPRPEPFAEQASAQDPFATMNPLSSFPMEQPASAPISEPEPLPASRPEPVRKLSQPGKMGQLAAFEESPPPTPVAPSPVTEPKSGPAASAMRASPAVISILLSMAIIASGLAWKKFSARSARRTVSKPVPSAPAPTSEPTPPPPPVPDPPAPVAKPRPPAASKPPVKIKRRSARKPKRAAATKNKEAAPPVAVAETDAQLESLLSAAQASPAEPVEKSAETPAPKIETKPAAPQPPAQAAESKHFTLPGLDRPVSAAARKNTPKAKTSLAAEPTAAQAMPLPGSDSSKTTSPDQTKEDDQPALAQVKEQFDFCTQLLAQGAYGDHYDTCLCKDARKAAPYRGRRSAYVSALKKSAADGRLDNAAKILSSTLTEATATVTAHWRVLPNEFGRDLTQTWRLEDGLWCRAPY